MASIDKVYRTVKNLANKEQKGFVTPAVFNRFAVIAQQNIYNELFTELVEAKKISRQNIDPGRDKSVRKRTLEDLSPFVTRLSNMTPASTIDAPNIFFKPTNLSRIISISIGNSVAGGYSINKTNVEIVYDVEKMDRILGSNLSTPTAAFPVALISDEIEVFPADLVSSIDMTYYRTPGGISSSGAYTDSEPQWNAIAAGQGQNLEIADPSSCVDFMLPEHYSSEIVYEIAKMIGISLNDPGMVQVASQEELRR